MASSTLQKRSEKFNDFLMKNAPITRVGNASKTIAAAQAEVQHTPDTGHEAKRSDFSPSHASLHKVSVLSSVSIPPEAKCHFPHFLTSALLSSAATKSSPATFSSDDFVHQNFVDYGRNAKEWLRKCALLLPEINRRQIWKKKGFENIFEYARILAGMSRFAVEDALRILEKVKNKPALLKVVEKKGLNAVRPVLGIVTPETEIFWAKNAEIMSKHTLETYVREYKKQYRGDEKYNRLECRTGTASQPGKGIDASATHSAQALPGAAIEPEKIISSSTETKTLTMDLSSDVAAELEKLKGKGDWNTLMKELLQLRKEKLEAEKPKPVETSSRHIPKKVKQFAVAKTRGQCAYPGCTKPYEILHHTQRFSLKNIHDPDRLIPLCEAHEHLAHHGLIANEDLAPDQWGILQEPEWWDLKQVVDERVVQYRKELIKGKA